MGFNVVYLHSRRKIQSNGEVQPGEWNKMI